MELTDVNKALIYTRLNNSNKIDAFKPYLVSGILKSSINSKQSLAAFLATVAHESGNFKYVEENLNYSRDSLIRVFGKYFSPSNIDEYIGQPQKIASRVYANRLGNGDEESGDGYTFRGRGLIQITGRYNYSKVSETLTNSDYIVKNPSALCLPVYAVKSALCFWDENNLTSLCNEIEDPTESEIIEIIEAVTKRVNGGYNGLKDRTNKMVKIYNGLKN